MMQTLLFVFKTLSALLCLNISASIAGIENAPKPFNTAFGKAVFVDFQTAEYNLLFDQREELAYADTVIHFEALEDGLPIFDSVNEPQAVWLDGEEVGQELVYVPGKVSKVRVALAPVRAGLHTLRIRTMLEKGVKYETRGISAGFFILDLKDRKFLERYVPTNYEYDNYQMTFRVQIENADHRWHDIFANGEVESLEHNVFEVTYPDHYTASSVYFHLVPRRKYWRYYLKYPSIDGREIPVTIYSNFRFFNGKLKNKAWRVLAELERDYGPYPHPKLIIYGTGIRGGMEYVGATATSLVSLGHELFHCYFAKGVMPANGNSGWLDEALASWRDKGYQSHSQPNYYSANLARHNSYTRKTDKRSYAKGRSFFAYIDYQLKATGLSLKEFLAIYFVKRKFTTITTDDFIHELEAYADMDFGQDFSQYIFGGHAGNKKARLDALDLNSTPSATDGDEENPHHPEYTEEEIDSLI